MALYPDVKCRILYQKDYLNLLIKYGLEEPSQALVAAADASGEERPQEPPEERPTFLGPALAG